jgi:hypothetical protein
MSNQAIFDFLVQTDNLKTALEVYEQIDLFKSEMHKRFWIEFGQSTNKRFAISEYTNTWKFVPHPAKSSKKGWGTSYFIPKGYDGVPCLRVGLGQTTSDNGYRLYWGVEWSTAPQSFDQTKLIDLRSDLISRGITIVNSAWVGWNYMEYTIYEAEFLKRLYTDPNPLIQEITEKYWGFFTGIVGMVEKINAGLGSNV